MFKGSTGEPVTHQEHPQHLSVVRMGTIVAALGDEVHGEQ